MPRARRHVRRRPMRFLVRTLLVLLLLALAASAAAAFWVYRELRAPHAHTRSAEYIDIPRGSSPDATVARLSSLGVVRHEWPLRLYIRLTGAGPRLKAGEY